MKSTPISNAEQDRIETKARRAERLRLIRERAKVVEGYDPFLVTHANKRASGFRPYMAEAAVAMLAAVMIAVPCMAQAPGAAPGAPAADPAKATSKTETKAQSDAVTEALATVPMEAQIKYLTARAAASSDQCMALRGWFATPWKITAHSRAVLEVDMADAITSQAEWLVANAKRGSPSGKPNNTQRFALMTDLRNAEITLTLTRARAGAMPDVMAMIATRMARISELRTALSK